MFQKFSSHSEKKSAQFYFFKFKTFFFQKNYKTLFRARRFSAQNTTRTKRDLICHLESHKCDESHKLYDFFIECSSVFV